MLTFRVQDVLKDRILISRESARLLEAPLRTMMENAAADGPSPVRAITVDFEGVEGMAPSFLDELVRVFDSLLDAASGGERALIVANPPTRLSSKFEAVGRGHGMSVRAQPDGSWILTDARDAGA